MNISILFNLFGIAFSVWCLADSKSRGQALFWTFLLVLNTFFLFINFSHKAEAQDFSLSRTETVVVSNDEGEGSGVAIGPHHILTAAHVVHGWKNVNIVFYGNNFPATGKVVYENPKTDIAIVELPVSSSIAVVSCKTLLLGQPAYTIGNAEGLGWLLTRGYVSDENPFTAHEAGPFIFLDIQANHGNSGGPVFNVDGAVIGILHGALTPPVEAGHITGTPLALMIPTFPNCNVIKEYLN